MPRLDTRQRRLLALLSPTEWRSTDAVLAGTTLYRSRIGIGIVLGQFAGEGLVERRLVGGHRCASEWRLLPAAERVAS